MTTNRVSPLNGNRANELYLALRVDEDIAVLIFTQQKISSLFYIFFDFDMRYSYCNFQTL